MNATTLAPIRKRKPMGKPKNLKGGSAMIRPAVESYCVNGKVMYPKNRKGYISYCDNGTVKQRPMNGSGIGSKLTNIVGTILFGPLFPSVKKYITNKRKPKTKK